MIYQLRKRAIHQCQEKTEAFVACSEHRLFSVVWACRRQLNELNECTKQQCVPLSLTSMKHQCVVLESAHSMAIGSTKEGVIVTCTRSTSDEVFSRLKSKWLERGSPRNVDWEDLMMDIS